jgi:hypothetical protein
LPDVQAALEPSELIEIVGDGADAGFAASSFADWFLDVIAGRPFSSVVLVFFSEVVGFAKLKISNRAPTPAMPLTIHTDFLTRS